MRLLTIGGFVLLLLGFMLFGVGLLPDNPASVPTTEVCGDQYEITVSEHEPGPGDWRNTGSVVSYADLSLADQKAFQLALVSNGTVRVDEPVLSNVSRVSYQGTLYVVHGASHPVDACETTPTGTDWRGVAFGLGIVLMLSGVVGMVKSLWNHL